MTIKRAFPRSSSPVATKRAHYISPTSVLTRLHAPSPPPPPPPSHVALSASAAGGVSAGLPAHLAAVVPATLLPHLVMALRKGGHEAAMVALLDLNARATRMASFVANVRQQNVPLPELKISVHVHSHTEQYVPIVKAMQREMLDNLVAFAEQWVFRQGDRVQVAIYTGDGVKDRMLREWARENFSGCGPDMLDGLSLVTLSSDTNTFLIPVV